MGKKRFSFASRATRDPELAKMLSAAVILVIALAAVANAAGMRSRQKRSVDYEQAIKEYSQATTGVWNAKSFDECYTALLPLIHSEMTVFACTQVCVGSAGSVLGPAAGLAPFVCPPLCDYGLQFAEEQTIAANDDFQANGGTGYK